MCSRVAGGDEPPSVLSDNLHNLIVRSKAPAFRRGFCVAVSHSDTPRRQVAHELEVRLGWSPVVSSSLQDAGHDVTERQRRYPCEDRVTGLDRCSRGPTKDIPARVGPCPPERPPVEARQSRICRASPPSSSARASHSTSPSRPRMPGVQLNVPAVDVHVLPLGGGPRTAGAGDRPR